eukprot:SAG11_NODE_630_length_8069_cov_2.158344_9_plen_88_part_00
MTRSKVMRLFCPSQRIRLDLSETVLVKLPHEAREVIVLKELGKHVLLKLVLVHHSERIVWPKLSVTRPHDICCSRALLLNCNANVSS